MNPRPLVVCGVLAVPCFVIAAVLHDRPPNQLESLDPPAYVVEEPVATTAVVPPATTILGVAVVSLPPAPAVVATQTADRGVSIQVTETVPAPYRWTADIPGHYGAPKCDVNQATVVAVAMHAEGANDASVSWMLKTISRESGCRHWVRNNNPNTGDDSFSLCQLNARAGHFGSNGVLAGWDRWRLLDDFTYAAEACSEMWSVCGRKPWQPPYGCSPPEELL